MILVRRGYALKAHDDDSLTEIQKIKEGEVVAVKVQSTDRGTIEAHNYLFWLTHLIFHNRDWGYDSPGRHEFDNWRFWLKKAQGWGEWDERNGEKAFIPESWEMDKLKKTARSERIDALKQLAVNLKIVERIEDVDAAVAEQRNSG